MYSLLDALLGPLLRTGLRWISRHRTPHTKGTLTLDGLQAAVTIYRDRWGVPHIYGDSARDVLFAQGYVHAQDRLWQMEFYRRLTAGRLAELLGPTLVPVDRWVRTLMLRRVAEREAALLDEETRASLEAYAAGVNAAMALEPPPIEFTLLRHKPEPWGPTDSLSWVKMMSWFLSINWETELLRAHLIAHLGEELAAELEPPCPDGYPRIVPPGVDYTGIGATAAERCEEARFVLGPPAREGLGSNSWVVGGERTTTGKPLLANDMHLLMTAPAIWYENHLEGGDLHVTGVTFVGIPGVVAGHNGRVAWGFTAGFPDVQDLYMERLRRTEDGRVQAAYNDTWYDVEVLHEEIRVRRHEPVSHEVIITRHGPVINALAEDLCGEQPLALRWTSFELDTMLKGLLQMNRADDCAAFREALRHWSAPVQNVVYADTAGNIAYSFPGRVPIRANGDGLVPVPGWTDAYEWTGYVPFEELPHLLNPPQGYVATANNRVADDSYPHYLGREMLMGGRSERIVELLESCERVDIAYSQRMQYDTVSPVAQRISRIIGQLEVGEDPVLRRVVALFRTWDGSLTSDSVPATIYTDLIRRLARTLLAPKLSGNGQLGARCDGESSPLANDLAERCVGKGPTPVLQESSLFGARTLEWLQQVLMTPESHWFNLGGGERRDDVLRLALQDTVADLSERLGPPIEAWHWGRLNQLTYQHTLSLVGPLASFFSRGPFPVGGDSTTICAAVTNLGESNHGVPVSAPYRMVLDLGDLRRSVGLLAPGISGQPSSPHYDDQIGAWFTGEYHPMLFAWEDVERHTESTLRLAPS